MKKFDSKDPVKEIAFMQLALEEAKTAMLKNEVPVGCVIVDFEGNILSRAHNKVETNNDATSHAEILAIQAASKFAGDWRLVQSTLYVTLEPCLMCAGAAILSRVKRIVYGCPDFRHGACGSLMDVFSVDHPIHKVEIAGGLLAQEASALLKQFFQERRKTIVRG